MAKSIRISDELYSLAQLEAALGTRSLAQQIEHWAKIGLALERDDVSRAREASIGYQRWSNDLAVQEGRKTQQSLLAVPESLAKSAKVEFPVAAFPADSGGW